MLQHATLQGLGHRLQASLVKKFKVDGHFGDVKGRVQPAVDMYVISLMPGIANHWVDSAPKRSGIILVDSPGKLFLIRGGRCGQPSILFS
jgi:hypothetical protein